MSMEPEGKHAKHGECSERKRRRDFRERRPFWHRPLTIVIIAVVLVALLYVLLILNPSWGRVVDFGD